MIIILSMFIFSAKAGAAEFAIAPPPTGVHAVTNWVRELLPGVGSQFPCDFDEAIHLMRKEYQPRDEITKDGKKIPIYGQSENHFFRAIYSTREVDESITKAGWKSGFDRGVQGRGLLPPSAPLEDRALEYAVVDTTGWHEGGSFPKNASVVGVSLRPNHILQVVERTGHEEPPNYYRLDELEIGPGARIPICRDLKMVDTSKALEGKKLKAKWDTEGEWVVDRKVPPECVVATYRMRKISCTRRK